MARWARIVAHDPVATANARKVLGLDVPFADDPYVAAALRAAE